MAINATAVWRVRAGGNDANGAAYDSAISGAGTDYSQQDAAQLSLTDIVCSATTTVTSVVGGFTSAMIGNAIRITGGGATSGYYFITARTDTNTITVDRTPGTVAAGTGNVGGAAATIARVATAGSATGDKVVAGNIIYIRGSGSNYPGSADYAYTAYFTPPNGTSTAPIQIVGENGRPRFDGTSYDLWSYNATNIIYKNVVIKAGAATNGNMLIPSTNCVIENCLFHLNDLNINGVDMYGAASSVRFCEFMSHATAPTTRSGKWAIRTGNFPCDIIGNTIYRCGGSGIVVPTSNMVTIAYNLIVKNKGAGMTFVDSYGYGVIHNTIDGNGGNGITVSDDASDIVLLNNLITNNGGYGLSFSSGTGDSNKAICSSGGNAFWNNTSGNGNNYNLKDTDLALGANPYTQSDPPTTNWAVGTSVKALGVPSAYLGDMSGVATTNYADIGAVQREEPAGGGGRIGGQTIIQNIGTY